MLKRVIKLVIILFLFVIQLPIVRAETEDVPTRAIYVVYDNSGSMYMNGNMAWSQATYAMEVFASMLDFNNGDVMVVYPMNQFTTNGDHTLWEEDETSWTSETIRIKSMDDISQIHDLFTVAPSGTPYINVPTAYNDLVEFVNGGKADEGWLIVLTDGEFQPEAPGYNASWPTELRDMAAGNEKISVQYLGVGADAKTLSGDDSVSYFADTVSTSEEVVYKMAEIGNRIFRRNEYPGYKSGDTLKFDVPMRKVIVFAQGENASIKKLANDEGEVKMIGTPKEVSYSTTTGAAISDFYGVTTTETDTTLSGALATFSSCESGEYKLDVSGVDSVAVYYEPDVVATIQLFSGNEPITGTSIGAGEYRVRAGFKARGSDEFIEDTKLLGTQNYTITVGDQTFNLNTDKKGYVEQQITVDKNSPDYISLEMEVSYLNGSGSASKNGYYFGDLEVEVSEGMKCELKSLEEGNSQVVTLLKSGTVINEETWNRSSLVVSSDADIEFEVEKGTEVGTYIVRPKYKEGDVFKTTTGDIEYQIAATAPINGFETSVSKTSTMNIHDDRTMLDMLEHYWKQILAGSAAFLLLFGYIPGVKKRFPRAIKNRPIIKQKANNFGPKIQDTKGKFEKDFLRQILPYLAETATYKFSQNPPKSIKLKAAGNKGMRIMNVSSVANKKNITFNGIVVDPNNKNTHYIRSSTICVVKGNDITNTSQPNIG